MIKIDKPEIDLSIILDNCISSMRENRKSRIINSKEIILQESKKYNSLAKEGELYTIEEHDSVNGVATKDDMEALYTQKFVPEGQANRKYYDMIKLLAPYSKCPYCGQNLVKTVDHFLPKAKYVTFSVTPDNLVPSCTDCNELKGATTFECYEKQPYHPYYDDISSINWLKARMIEKEVIAFEFYAEPPLEWGEQEKNRLINYFENLHLNDIYKVHAAELYDSKEERFKMLYIKGGKTLAIKRLNEEVEDASRKRNNTWKAAMYQAIIDNDWYWNVYMPQCAK